MSCIGFIVSFKFLFLWFVYLIYRLYLREKNYFMNCYDCVKFKMFWNKIKMLW